MTWFNSASSINHDRYNAGGISSPAYIETEATYKDRIPFYEENNFSYIPLPFEQKFYDVDESNLEEMDDDQFVHFDERFMRILHAHRSAPFLLLNPMEGACKLYEEEPENETVFKLSGSDSSPSYMKIYPSSNSSRSNVFKVREAVEEYPSLKSDFREIFEKRFHIITPADLNRRDARRLPFNIIAELEMTLAQKIEEEFSDSRELFPSARPETIGRWEQARLQGIEVHIAEYMTLSGLLNVIGKSDPLLEECGYPSRNQLDKQLGSLIDLRNRVMHTNRTLVHGQEDVEKLVDRLQRAEGAISQIQ